MLNRYPTIGIRGWNFDLYPYLRFSKNPKLRFLGTMLVWATTLFLVCGGQDGKSTLFLGPGVARKSRRTRRGAYAHCPPLCPEICSVLWPHSGLPWRFPRPPPARVRANATQSHETVETATKPPRNRDETPEANHETEYFFNMMKNMFSFVKKMFGFVVCFGGFVAVSWRFRGGFDGFVALRGKTQVGSDCKAERKHSRRK